MPTRITNFLHDSTVSGAQALGVGFTAGAVHNHDLQDDLPAFQREARNFRGIVEGVFVRLSHDGGASPPAAVTIRICTDAAGDFVLVPDTVATPVAGITTAATQSVAYSVGLPLFQPLSYPGNGSLYLFVKVDDATENPLFAQSSITWRE
tara:strand:+ start:4730 stop:5179 length:450 start_codon:yes stop_codon:yes gene_type:complete